MFKSLKIENFRGFKSFELQHLGRVNLLVGANNSGKTSILEAIQLLCSRKDISSLEKLMTYRGEYFGDKDKLTRGKDCELDIRHLFYRREIALEAKFSIAGITDSIQEKLIASISTNIIGEIQENISAALSAIQDPQLQKEFLELFSAMLTDSSYEKPNDREELSRDIRKSTNSEKIYLVFQWSGQESEFLRLPLSIRGSCYAKYRQPFSRPSRKQVITTQFVTPFSLEVAEIIALFDNIVLTPNEIPVIEALKIIEPKIERIASVTTEKYLSRKLGERGGFVVKLSDNEHPIPIGSMGDGIWRLLGLALATVSAQGGVLLVDEIDSGLHYSTMSDMWKIIWETATKLDVQVFATTHSSDCWQSLASIASKETENKNRITIHRIEPDKNNSVMFNEPEIIIAANRDIEVR